MAIIRNIRQLKDAGVLGERKPATPSLELKRYNLLYGFNGAGKSTLSRLFSTLQQGNKHERLPENCTFEVEMDDGTKYACPKSLGGLEKRVCVFNQDFITTNLRWEDGEASPIFYIGSDQADAAAQLKTKEDALPAARALALSEEKVLKEREKAFAEYKKLLARDVSDRLRQPARYEATQLVADFKAGAAPADFISPADLDAAATTSARTDAPAKVDPVNIDAASILSTCEAALTLAPMTIGAVVVANLEGHPEMVPWVRDGHLYHLKHGLKDCLYCGERVSDARRTLLSSAFDDKMNSFISSLNDRAVEGASTSAQLDVATAAIPAAAQLSAEFQPLFESAAAELTASLDEVRPMLARASSALRARQSTPTAPVAVSLPTVDTIHQMVATLEARRSAVNAIISKHSGMVDDFLKHQQIARTLIRKHFVARDAAAYQGHIQGVEDAAGKRDACQAAVETLESEIAALKAQVQQHGIAAGKINTLVGSYLGHGELTIVPVAEGYELHRHNELVTGPPSEGEKTAIALCYFLSTLEADGRKVSDLIVVVDDPVSSLDTKAMNYACSLIRNRLESAAQVVILTHNLHCMNEFKKDWKSKARATPPTARLLFVDVTAPAPPKTRTSTIKDLPKQLREYDSEYHFLFQRVLQFEPADLAEFDYVLMMPNVLRRVLEIFLAFKVPRSGNISDKLNTLCDRHETLDRDRLNALERLSQVESHSDSLDDLITQSTMTIEESHDAMVALIYLMQSVDRDHLADLRKYCAP